MVVTARVGDASTICRPRKAPKGGSVEASTAAGMLRRGEAGVVDGLVGLLVQRVRQRRRRGLDRGRQHAAGGMGDTRPSRRPRATSPRS